MKLIAERLEKLGRPVYYQKIIHHPAGYTLIPFLTGLAGTLGLAPFNSWVAMLAVLIVLFFILTVLNRKKEHFCALLFFFTAYHSSSLWWLNFVMMDFGRIPAALSFGVVILFGVYLALPYALLGLLAFKLSHDKITAFNLAFLPSALVAADFIIGYLFTGFPWTYVGYSTLTGPFSSYAPLIGVRGINLLLYISSGAVCLTILRQYIYLPIAGVIVIIGILIKGIVYTHEDERYYPVTLVQGNIAQQVRWSPEMVGPTLSTYINLSLKALNEGRIVIWPEAAIPLLTRDAMPVLSDLNFAAFDAGSYLITGIQHLEIQNKKRIVTNSIITLGDKINHADELDLKRYDKRHLVPFGEFVPFDEYLRPLGSIFNFPMSAFTEGAPIQDPIKLGDLILNPAICYEAVFPELMYSLDSPEISGILMLSNDSWFGPTRGPEQHLAIAKMRALEMQKPVIRVTNSGITALIGADASTVAAIALDTKEALDIDFKGRKGQTPYSRFGLIPLALMIIVLLCFGCLMLKKGPNSEQQALLKLLRP